MVILVIGGVPACETSLSNNFHDDSHLPENI